MKRYLLILFIFLTCSLSAEETWKNEDSIRTASGIFSRYSIPQHAALYYATGKYKKAAKLYGKLYEISKIRHNLARAKLLEASSWQKAGEYIKAHAAFQKVIKEFSELINFKDALNQQYKNADNFYAARRKNHGFFKTFDPVIEMYRDVVKNAPFDKRAPGALKNIGDMHWTVKEYAEAAESYRSVIKYYKTSTEAGIARLKLAEYFFNYLKGTGGDASMVIKAKDQLNFFLAQHQKHPDRKKAEKMLVEIGEFEAKRFYDLAIFYLDESSMNEKYRIWPLYPHRKTHERKNAAKRYLNTVLVKYPKSKIAPKCETLLAKLNRKPVPTETKKKTPEAPAKKVEKKLPPEAKDYEKRDKLKVKNKKDFLIPPENLKPIGSQDKKK